MTGGRAGFALGGFALLLIAGTATAELPEVDPRLPLYAPQAGFSGTLTCAGGDTMRNLTETWATRFEQVNPEAHVTVNRDSKLSADGFRALLEGSANCVTFVREPFPSELKAFQDRFGHAPLLVPVAGGSYATKGGTHAIAIYVNAVNPLGRLDLAELDAISSSTRRRGGEAITRWGQLGLTGAWADRPIHLYGMQRRRATGDPPGIVNYLTHRVLLGGTFRDDVEEQVDQPGQTALEAIVDHVAADPNGIGYSGFGYAAPGVKSLALAVTTAGPYYSGTEAEVARRDYPLSRSIYLMFGSPSEAAAPPIIREFLRFVTSRDGQQIVASDPEGFLPLSATEIRRRVRLDD